VDGRILDVQSQDGAVLPQPWYEQTSHSGGVRRLGTLVAEKSLRGHFAWWSGSVTSGRRSPADIAPTLATITARNWKLSAQLDWQL
jgi:hypothetical protein